MSAAISTDTSHSTVKNSQLGQNLFGGNEDFLKDKSIRLWFPSCYIVYYGKEIGCYSLVCEQPGASGRGKHVSLPFLMQPKETYNPKCHCSSTSHKHRGERLSIASYFLKSRMAMTMMMMRTTANTGPITHNISGCSIP